MSLFGSNPQSVHSQRGKKSIRVFQELSVTSPLNPGCATNIGIFQKTRVTSSKQKHLICLFLKVARRTSSDHERENWIIHIVYSHLFLSQTKLRKSTLRKFNTARWPTSQQWDPCLHTFNGGSGSGVNKTKSQNISFMEGCWSRVRKGEVTEDALLEGKLGLSFHKDLRLLKVATRILRFYLCCALSFSPQNKVTGVRCLFL